MKRSSLLPPLSSRSSSLQLHKDKQASEHNFCLCSGKFFRNKAATWRRAIRAGKKKRKEGKEGGGTKKAAHIKILGGSGSLLEPRAKEDGFLWITDTYLAISDHHKTRQPIAVFASPRDKQ